MKNAAWVLFAAAILTVVVAVVVVFQVEAWDATLDETRPSAIRVLMGAWALAVLGLIALLGYRLRPLKS